jgi:hypothetical protein
MATDLKVDIRPRATGEVLDDAIRLGLADAPLLLALSGLFLIPAWVALLFLLALPSSGAGWVRLGLPAATALLLPLTGLGSGACQELFRRRASDIPVSLRSCLGASLRRGLDHVAARALALTGGALGLVFLVAPGLAVWMTTAAVHALLAGGDVRMGGALRESARVAQRNSGKAAAVTLGRIALLLFSILNLHILIKIALWIAGNLGGLDVALLDVVLVLSNPAYLMALGLLAWWLLAPFAEACNYLLHVDTRVRYEGLDLLYRVQRLFPVAERSRTTVLLLLVAGAVLILTVPLRAADQRTEAVQAARKEVSRVSDEVRAAEPYPGGERWTTRLQTTADGLKRAADGRAKRYAWFDQAIDDFARQNRRGALQTLEKLDSRLTLIEESLATDQSQEGDGGPHPLSPEEMRKLLPDKPSPRSEKKEKKEPPPRKKAEEIEVETKGSRGPGIVTPAPGAGFGLFAWFVLGGLLLACIIVAVIFYLQERKTIPKADKPKQTGETSPSLESVLLEPDRHTATALWQQADDLARQGQFLEAVRRLYLAVLALLHRSHLIRYEKPRTNGEYVRQVRLSPEAPAELHTSFGRLTRLFDQKWYGDRACDGQEYGACRTLAEEVRAEVKG